MIDKRLFFRRSEVAELMGVCPRTISKFIKTDPSFPYIKIGSQILFPKEEFREWIHTRSMNKTK